MNDVHHVRESNEVSNKSRLYVGGLAYSVNDEQLKALFDDHGSVKSAKVIRDPTNQRSKGFGFVEMATAVEANKAIEELDNFLFEGRQIKVARARPIESGGRRGGGGGRSSGGGYRDRGSSSHRSGNGYSKPYSDYNEDKY